MRLTVIGQYTDVMRNFTYAALGASIPAILMCFFLPDLLLPEYVSPQYPHLTQIEANLYMK